MDIYKAQHMAFPRGPVYLAGSIGTFLLRIGDEYISIIFKMAQSQVHNQSQVTTDNSQVTITSMTLMGYDHKG